MKFWFELPDVLYVTSEYGRYEAVRDISRPESHGAYTWTPVLAGPPGPAA